MHDNEINKEILRQINFAIERVISSCERIHTFEDFALTNDGLLRLESACMLISTIGESVKNLDKRTHGTLLKNYHSIEWKKITGMRDIIAHHYFDIDTEIVFDVVKNKLPKLQIVIEKIINDINSQK
ncbi:MAG: DUF86 domain-containing protein [Tannerella sp.]|jgi:uncharacterized protein with HEPN domain|nr:DUF86 domain-containing protein [Tannerella sp.]